MKYSWSLLSIILLLVGCSEHPATGENERRAALIEGTADSARYSILCEQARSFARTDPDSAWACLLKAEAMAKKIGGDSLRYDVEDLHFEVLNGPGDSAAVSYAERLVVEREPDAPPKPRVYARMSLALALAQRGNSFRADSLLRASTPIAETTKDSSLIAQILMLRMTTANAIWPADTALALADQAVAFCNGKYKDLLAGKIRVDLANALYLKGLLDSAITEIKLAMSLNEHSHDDQGLVGSISMLAAYLSEKGEWAKVVDLQLRAIALGERLGMRLHVAINTLNLGDTYKALLRPHDALACYKRACALADSVRNEDLQWCAFGAQTAIWLELDSAGLERAGIPERARLDTVISALRVTLDHLAKTGNQQQSHQFELTMGQAYLRKKEPALAETWTRKVLVAAQASGDKLMEGSALEGLGDVAFSSKDWTGVLRNYQAALAICDQLERKEHQAYLLDRMHLAYELNGDLPNALASLRKAKALSLTLFTDSTSRVVAQVEARAGYEKRQLTDSLAHAQALFVQETGSNAKAASQRKTLWMVIGGALLLLAGSGIAFYLDRRRKQERFEKDSALLETQALRSQMNPHFIFNALNSINAYVQTNEADKASDYLAQFARLMRMVLENSRHAEVPLKDDLDALRAYLELERARSNERFDYSIEVDHFIDMERTLVPPLVLQPFVENAIWHGMAGRSEKGHVRLKVSMKDDQLVMTVEDDGVGRKKRSTEEVPDTALRSSPIPRGSGTGQVKKSSLGTAITQARLDLVSKQKGRPAGFTYTDLPQGTRVEVTLPASIAA